MNVCDVIAPRFPPGFSRGLEGVPAGSTMPCSLIQIQNKQSKSVFAMCSCGSGGYGAFFWGWIGGKEWGGGGFILSIWGIVLSFCGFLVFSWGEIFGFLSVQVRFLRVVRGQLGVAAA